MRILVLSDSHGAVEACRLAVEQSTPDQILHLGDCVRDAERLHALFPAIPLTGVPGNCDGADADNPERLIELGGVRILMMHGHTRGVKTVSYTHLRIAPMAMLSAMANSAVKSAPVLSARRAAS